MARWKPRQLQRLVGPRPERPGCRSPKHGATGSDDGKAASRGRLQDVASSRAVPSWPSPTRSFAWLSRQAHRGKQCADAAHRRLDSTEAGPVAAAVLPASDAAEGPLLKTRRPARPAKRMPQRDFREGKGGNARVAGLEQNRKFSSVMMVRETSPSSQRSNNYWNAQAFRPEGIPRLGRGGSGFSRLGAGGARTAKGLGVSGWRGY